MIAALEASYADSDDDTFVNRPDVEKLFQSVINCGYSKYHVIVGGHGTGKSTLAMKAARRTPGAIYINITAHDKAKVTDQLEAALDAALGRITPANHWFLVLMGKCITIPTEWLQPGKRALVIPLRYVLTNYCQDNKEIVGINMGLLGDFEMIAARFKAKHGSSAVLIIDNANAIAESNPDILHALQEIAQVAVDNCLYNIVFVVSDGVVPAAMRGESRCACSLAFLMYPYR
jgi:hypothetical protein